MIRKMISPVLQKVFRFSLLHPIDIVICPGAGAAGILWIELLKLANRRKAALAG